MVKQKKVNVTVSLDLAVVEKLREFAAKNERSVSYAVNRILAEDLGLRPKKRAS